jgi:hypothetical protein
MGTEANQRRARGAQDRKPLAAQVTYATCRASNCRAFSCVAYPLTISVTLSSQGAVKTFAVAGFTREYCQNHRTITGKARGLLERGINGRVGSPYVGDFRLFVALCGLQYRRVANSLQSHPPEHKATVLPSLSQDTNSGPSAKTSPSGQVPRGALPRVSLGTAERIQARGLVAS